MKMHETIFWIVDVAKLARKTMQFYSHSKLNTSIVLFQRPWLLQIYFSVPMARQELRGWTILVWKQSNIL